MPEPTEPSQSPPPPPIPAVGPTSDPSSMDLPPNVAAALACIPLVGGIIFYILEKRNGFVRFYAMQSIIFGIAWILILIACAILAGLFGAIPVVGGIFASLWNLVSWLIYLALFVLMVVAMVKAFTGVRWEIPYVGPMAGRQVQGGGGS
jgi:uncharacterized membrane protein